MTANTVIEETVSANRHAMVTVRKPEKSTNPNADHVLFIWIGTSMSTICLTGLASYRAFVQCMKSACATVECVDPPPRKVRGVAVEAIHDGHVHSMGEVAIHVRYSEPQANTPGYRITVSAPQPGTNAANVAATMDLAPSGMSAAEVKAVGDLFVKIGKNRRKAVMTATGEEWFVPPFFRSWLADGCVPTTDCFGRIAAHIKRYSPMNADAWGRYLWQLQHNVAGVAADDRSPAPARFIPWLDSPPYRPWDDYEAEVDDFRQFGKDFAAKWLTDRRAPDSSELIAALVDSHRFLPAELATRIAERIAEHALKRAVQ